MGLRCLALQADTAILFLFPILNFINLGISMGLMQYHLD